VLARQLWYCAGESARAIDLVAVLTPLIVKVMVRLSESTMSSPTVAGPAVLDEVITPGSVLWLQDGLCVQFESKPMQGFSAPALAILQLADLSAVQRPRARLLSRQWSVFQPACQCSSGVCAP
jgi:hypothetical protein